jgi:tetratricopeptide (TPR) repeat protein
MNLFNQTAGIFFCLIVLGFNGFLDTPQAMADEPTELYVRTTPKGAKVFLNGKELGLSPDLFKVEPGTAKIVVKLEGYDPIEKELEIQASRINRLELEFKNASRAIEQDPGTNRVGGRNSIPAPSVSEVLDLVQKAKQETKEGSLNDARFTLEKAHGLALKLKGVDFHDFGPKDRALHEIVQAYLVLKDFQSALSAAKEIWNQDRKHEAFLDVVMGALQAGETDTAIDYTNQLEKDYRLVLTELYPTKTKKLKELFNQEAKRSNSQTPPQGKATISAAKDSETSDSEKAVFVEVLKLVEKAKREAKEGSLIDARVTLEEANDLTAKLKKGSNVTQDCPKDRALHEIVRAYVVLKDFAGAFVTAQEMNNLNRKYEAIYDVVKGAVLAGESETATNYFEEFNTLNPFAIGQKEKFEKLLNTAKANQSDQDGNVFAEVLKMVKISKQQAKNGDINEAHRTLEKACDLTGNLKEQYYNRMITNQRTLMERDEIHDCPKYRALHEIVNAYLVLNDFQSALATAKEIWNRDRRRIALYDVIMGTARAGEVELALRYLGQIKKDEGLILKQLPQDDEDKLRELLNKEANRGHGRAPSQGKTPLPRKEEKGKASQESQISTSIKLRTGKLVSGPLLPAEMLISANSPDDLIGYWKIKTSALKNGDIIALIETPGGFCERSSFPVDARKLAEFEKGCADYWKDTSIAKDQKSAFFTKALMRMGGDSEYWEICFENAGDTVCGKASWDLAKNTHSLEVCFPAGSVISFDTNKWVHFLGAKFRSGGFAVKEGKVKFLSGTEVETENKVLKFDGTSWK